MRADVLTAMLLGPTAVVWACYAKENDNIIKKACRRRIRDVVKKDTGMAEVKEELQSTNLMPYGGHVM